MEGESVTRWGAVLLRGIVGILFGIVLLAWPQATVSVAFWAFAIFALAAGMVSATIAVSERRERTHWVWSALGGVASMIMGVVIIVWPESTARLLLAFIAIVALVWGLSDLVVAVGIRKQASTFSVVMMALAGLVSIAFGLYALVDPGEGALAILWLIGVYALVWGFLLVVASFGLRSVQKGGAHEVSGA